MADRVRLQIKKVIEPEEWEDVGLGVEIPVTDGGLSDGSAVTKIKETIPTDSATKLNPSGTITPVTVGFDTTFTQTKLISGTTYTRTCTLNSNTGVFTYSNWS